MDGYQTQELLKVLRSIDSSLRDVVEVLGELASPEKPS